MNIEDTVAITANYASLTNLRNVWKTLIEFDVDSKSLEQVCCQVLNQTQRDELEYSCDCSYIRKEF